jgi:hypothetical protein
MGHECPALRWLCKSVLLYMCQIGLSLPSSSVSLRATNTIRRLAGNCACASCHCACQLHWKVCAHWWLALSAEGWTKAPVVWKQIKQACGVAHRLNRSQASRIQSLDLRYPAAQTLSLWHGSMSGLRWQKHLSTLGWPPSAHFGSPRANAKHLTTEDYLVQKQQAADLLYQAMCDFLRPVNDEAAEYLPKAQGRI